MLLRAHTRICYTVAFLLTLPLFSAWGATVSDKADTTTVSVNVYFQQGWSKIDLKYRDNERNLLSFIATVDSLSADTADVADNIIHIRSAASPEGRYQRNLQLSRNRTASTLSFFKSHLKTSGIIYETESVGEDWEGLACLLDSASFEGAQKAAEIIRTTPYYVIENGKIVTGRKKILMDMQGGRLWWKMNELLFPELRTSSVSVSYTRVLNQPELSQEVEEPEDSVSREPEAPKEEETPTVQETPQEPEAPKEIEQPQEAVSQEPEAPQQQAASQAGEASNLTFALRTNLLFDVATLINCGIEVPVGNHISVEADVYFPWWQIPSKDITVQFLGGFLEGKYWFRDRRVNPTMTGLSAGVYTGAGLYDLQLGNGIQGELFILGGLSVGYAHQIGDNLRLEYSLGLGYVQSDFREYSPAKDTRYGNIKIRQYPWEDKRFSGFMPSKASISLVWLLNTKKGGRK